MNEHLIEVFQFARVQKFNNRIFRGFQSKITSVSGIKLSVRELDYS